MDYWRFRLIIEHGHDRFALVGEARGETRADVIETAMRRFGLQQYGTDLLDIVEQRKVDGEWVPTEFHWFTEPAFYVWRLDEDMDVETAVTQLPGHVLMERAGAPRLL